MGNLAFDITKNVNLNKVVNLNIDKNVEVDVDIDDLLATAEADAEAFGERALAETDAYTYVREDTSDCEPTFSSGQLQFEGNVEPFAPDPDPTVAPGEDIEIVFNQDSDPGVNGELPDVDDFNAIGHFSPMDGDPAPPADTGLPQPTLSISDLTLNPFADIPDPPDEPNQDLWEYVNQDEILIDFGTRSIDRNGDGEIEDCETGTLTATIPEDSIFSVSFETENGAVEIGLELDTTASNPATLIFDPDCDSAVCMENTETFTMLADVNFIAETLGGLAEYDFNMLTDEIVWYQGGSGDGEAFSYAESTAALDLNGDDNVIPIPVETEV